jgi:osmotically-inducible protein OsmY
MKRNDSGIRDDVRTELKWDPRVHDPLNLGVAVKNAVTTLSGTTGSYAEKWAAGRAAERVAGVAAVANELVVRPPGSMERTDEDVAQAVVNALRASLSVPDERIKVAVATGWVTLEGDVDHRYQRESAEQAIRFLVGVRGISNLVTVKPPVNENVVKSDIEAALKRIAEVDARSIRVHADGNKVSLTGEVRSSAERRAAERATWAAPGVFEVENHISVGR